MQDSKDKKIVSRYFTVIILMAIVGIAILFKAMSVMIFERNYWREVASRSVVDSVIISPKRGNILSDDGQLMASSVPQYQSCHPKFLLQICCDLNRIFAGTASGSVSHTHKCR